MDRTLPAKESSAGEAVDRRSSKYSAFISYSRAADGKLAPALQRGLQRFAKPWYRLRALRLFRDDASLSANPDLWGSIEQALDDSDFLILLASPEAAQSKWVAEEARWWLEHKGTDQLLIVLSDGELAWGQGGLDEAHTNALPEPLRGVFAEEPRYVDVRWAREEEQVRDRDARFRNVLADLAAPLHGRSKDDMLGEDVRQHRRALTAAWTAGITVAALGVAAAVLAVLAVAARNDARTQARVALTRALAAQSGAELVTRPQVSALLALESFRLVADDRPERAYDARNVMLQNLERSPRTTAVLNTGVSVSNVAFNPDGRTLAAAGVRRTVQLWDAVRHVRLGRPLKTGEVFTFAFLKDGKTLAAVIPRETDYALTLWDVVHGTQIGKPRHVASNLAQVAFSADGEALAAVEDGKATVWSTRRKAPSARPFRVVGDSAIAVSNGAHLLAIGDNNGTIRLWNVASGTLDGASLPGRPSAYEVAFSPEATRLATLEIADPPGNGTSVRLWDLRRRRQVGRTLRGGASADALSFSRDGSILAGAGDGVRLWNGRTGSSLGTLVGHAGASTDVAFGVNGLLASAGGDATVRLWDTSRPEPLGRPLPVRPAELTTAVFAPDVRTLAAVNYDGRLTVRDLTRSTDPLRFRGNFASAAISPSGGLLAGGGQDGIVRVWKLPGHLLARLPVRQGQNPDLSTFEPEKVPAWERGLDPVWSLAFSADGKTLAAGGRAGSVVYWDTATWQVLGGPLDGGGAPGALAFSADGALLAGARDVAKVWNVTGERREPARLPFGGDLLSRASVAFNPDGSTLATASQQGIRLWRTAGWNAPGRALQRGAGAVSRIAFSADGATLVAAGDVMRLWDPVRQQELGNPLGTPGFYSLEGLAVGADGRTLVTAAGDGSVIRWDPILLSRDYAAWQKRLCPFAGRNLTRPEWAQYVTGQPYHRTCPGFP